MSWNIKTPGDYINGPLTVAGSATITGDLTVATDAFKVISATKDVCIGTVTPTFNNKLTVVGGGGGDAFITSGNGTRTGYIGTDGTYVIMGGYSNHTLRIHANDVAQMQIAPLGLFEWYDGAGGTRMTLNSTGLGIGASPATKLDVRGANNASQATFSGTASRGLLISTRSDGLADDRTVILNAQHSTGAQGQLVLQTVGTDRLLIDSSGNVGVGVTPSAWGSSLKAFELGAKGNALFTTASVVDGLFMVNNAYFDTGYKYAANGYASRYTQYQAAHQWFNAPSGTAGNAITFTQAMTLDATGALLVGCATAPNPGAATTSSGFSLNGNGNNAYIAHKIDNSILGYFRRDGTDGDVFAFYKANSNVGTISVTTTATAYNTSSDYRLKESAQPLVGGLARVNALKPSVYKWKVNGSAGEGFLAHELAEMVPLAVTGDKDAVDADGKPAYQGVDMSRIVPILVAAIQELTAEVNALKNA